MKSALSKPARIRRILYDRIASGKYSQDGPLPSERELAGSFSVSMATMREAISLLVAEGCLRRVQGKGTFIVKQPPPGFRGLKAINLYVLDAHGMQERDPFIADLLCGIHRALSKSSGLPARLVSLEERGEGFSEIFVKHEIEYLACGALFASYALSPEDAKRLKESGVKAASIGRQANAPEVPFVEVDHAKGIEKALEMLTGLGHKRIAMLDVAKPLPYLRNRREGFEKALAAHHAEGRFIPLTRISREEALRGLGEFLSEGFAATAYLCVGDRPTLACFKLLAERGLRVPEDISIVSYSDYSWIDDACGLVFTKVSQPTDLLAKEACKILLGETAEREIWHEPRLLAGASCAQRKT